MPRIRTLKPEFWQDEKLSPLPPLDRLVFLGLISMADDAGRLIDNVKLIDGLLFPHTSDTSRDPIESLARLKRVCRYTSASGQKCLQIIGWSRHQKVDNPAKHLLPPPTAEDLDREWVTESSRDPSETVARLSRSDLGPRIMDLGPRTNDLRPSGARKRDAKGKSASEAFPTALCETLYDAWVSNIGATEYPHFRKTLAPLFPKTAPLYTESELAAAIVCFSQIREGQPEDKQQFYTPQKFAGGAKEYVRLGKMPNQDEETGIFTERGRLAMGSFAS